MSRASILERVRAAVARRSVRADAPALPASQSIGDPVGLFTDRARQVGVLVETVNGEALPSRVAEWCAERDVRRALAWDVPELGPVREALVRAGVDIVSPGAQVADLAAADAGITGADWAIAECGSLALATDAARPRLASLLPPRHLAVLAADRILPDLPALFERCGSLPSALTLITGPSRSADIGFVPVLGAHGPMEVTVFIV